MIRTLMSILPLAAAAWPAVAATPDALLRDYEATARRESPAWTAASPQRGAQFFRALHGGDWRCSSCHTDDPRAGGRHARTQAAIAPLSPLANPVRLTDAAKVEKWFRRNCTDVVGRACTAAEKADVVAFLNAPAAGAAR